MLRVLNAFVIISFKSLASPETSLTLYKHLSFCDCILTHQYTQHQQFLLLYLSLVVIYGYFNIID